MKERRSETRAYALLALVMLFWAGNSIVGRAVRNDIPPSTLPLVRWAVALLVLPPFALKHVFSDRRALMRGWKQVLLLGLVGVGAFNAFLYSGLRYTTATNGLLLQAAIPALVLAFDFLLFGKRVAPWQLTGVLLSTIGVATIIFQAQPLAILTLRFGFGDLLILCAIVAWSLYTVCLRLKPEVHGASLLTITFMVGVLTMLPLAAMEWREGATIQWRGETFAAFAYVAILPSVLAYFLFNAAVEQIGPARAGQAISLMPLFGAILAALLLHEPLHFYHAIGMALIFAGIITAAWTSSRNPAARP